MLALALAAAFSRGAALCQNRTVLESDAVELSSRIAEARELAGLTQEQLAAAVGLGRTVIAKIEAGSRKLAATELVVLARSTRPACGLVLQRLPSSGRESTV